MKKAYEAHELAYRTMRKKGIRAWEHFSRRKKGPEIDPDTRRFLTDVLAQPWAPKAGKVVELGCGTGPILRWLVKRGFAGLGVDISRTAIAMAKEQSKGLGVRLRQADACSFSPKEPGTFDLAVDGHCLHCIVEPTDRGSFLRTVRRLLKPGGVFVVQTMCSPVDRTIYKRHRGASVLKGRTLYVPATVANEYEGCIRIAGRRYLPTRYLDHWKCILKDIRTAGFAPRIIRHAAPWGDEFTGDLSVGAVAV